MHSITRIVKLKKEVAILRALASTLAQSNFGTLTPTATKLALAALASSDSPVDLIVIDIRKMHELNAVLGWDTTTATVTQLLACRHAPGRAPDVLGQLGGDEFVIAVPAGDGSGMLRRLLSQAAAITTALPESARARLRESTGGLVDGVAVAAMLIEGTMTPLTSTLRALPLVAAMKADGRQTGERATSGAAGTLVCRVAG